MPVNYCFLFSHCPSSDRDSWSSAPRERTDQFAAGASAVPLEPQTPHQFSSELDNDAFSSIVGWSSSTASSLKSFLPSSVTSLFSTDTSNDSDSFDSYLQRAQSNLSRSSFLSWGVPPSSESPGASLVQEQAPYTKGGGPPDYLQPQVSKDTTRGRTTFSFVLFATASCTAAYLLARSRRNMNRLQSAKSLAKRDARAWRRVALEFAKINALATSRVQNLVGASLSDGRVSTDLGRKIERELEEAARTVAQRCEWIQEQDNKEAKAADFASSQPSFADAWREAFDPRRTGFFFGGRAGYPSPGRVGGSRWQPRHCSRHDDVSSVTAAARAPRSAQQKWQRVVGHSAAAATSLPSSSSLSDRKGNSLSSEDTVLVSDNDAQAQAGEEWIGDVDRAMRERDRKASQSTSGTDQAAVNAFALHETEACVDAITGFALREANSRVADFKVDDHLLPVSDLHIATDGRLREEPGEQTAQSKHKSQMGPAQVKTNVTNTANLSYPIPDRFRDMDDILATTWDDSNGDHSPLATISSSAKAEKREGTTAVKPNTAFFDRLRSQRQEDDKSRLPDSPDMTEFVAEIMFPKPAPEQPASTNAAIASASAEAPAAPGEQVQELLTRIEAKEAEISAHKRRIDELSERLDTMREACNELTDELQRREKTSTIQIAQLEDKVGLITVWAEEMQRRLGLETPPFFASLRKPRKRD